MMRERWGSFSVADHNATDKLVTDVLAYDRLVFPTPPDEGEHSRWKRNGWNPDLLKKRLDQLGDRALTVPWDETRRTHFVKNMERARGIAHDAGTLIDGDQAYQMTRMILAETNFTLPRGVPRPTVVTAYHSLDDLKREFLFDREQTHKEHLSILVRNRIAQPAPSKDPEDALRLAIELSRDRGFQERRRSLYRWQDEVLLAKRTPAEAMDELEDLIEKYNLLVGGARRTVAYRFVFTIVAIGVAVTGALLGNPLLSIPAGTAAASSTVSLVRFATLDRSAVVSAGEAAPAAMFHDIEAKL